ncbi:MAG: Gfo/Idh/MocA family oxidoreductase [Anaerolineae bacterium]|nr:Gfo/Idh/MocA family oxidoreductase [Anaerolineae bacterium]
MTQKIRWGILSTANIGTKKVIPAMQRGQYCDIAAISSRDLARAQAEAAKLGIAKAYGSYEALLADPDIDAIYNPMPNHLHVPWAIKALEAGKHVLCEKPIGLSAAEGEQLVAAAKAHPHLKVMEAFMYRHHPQWVTAKQLVKTGAIGQLRNIQSIFTYYNVDPNNVRNMSDIGGGGLMDIGCYNISLSRFLFDAEPQRVVGVLDYDPTFNTDRLVSGMMDFGDGNVSGFVCAMQLNGYQRVQALGTKGRIEIEIPFNAPPDKPCKLWLQQGPTVQEMVFDVCDQYTIQGDLMSQAILNDTPVPTPIEDAVANMRVIEAIVASGHHGGWQKL